MNAVRVLGNAVIPMVSAVAIELLSARTIVAEPYMAVDVIVVLGL